MGYLSEELDAKRTVIHTMYLVLMACMQSGYQGDYHTLQRRVQNTAGAPLLLMTRTKKN